MLLCQQVQRECDVEASSFALWQHKTWRHSSCFIRRHFAARNACQAIYQSPSNKSRVPALEISEAAITRSRYVTRSKLLHARACASSAVLSERERERNSAIAGPPSLDVQSAESSSNKQSASGSMAETPWPSPGLSHRQRDRPVSQLSTDPGKASISLPSKQSPSQKQLPQSDATPSAQTQSPAFPPQDAAQRPRASLQPLSAIQQKPYASANSQAPVRHADFAEGQQSANAVATVQFWLTFHAEFGQRLRVVGSHKNLGMCSRACTGVHSSYVKLYQH